MCKRRRFIDVSTWVGTQTLEDNRGVGPLPPTKMFAVSPLLKANATLDLLHYWKWTKKHGSLSGQGQHLATHPSVLLPVCCCCCCCRCDTHRCFCRCACSSCRSPTECHKSPHGRTDPEFCRCGSLVDWSRWSPVDTHTNTLTADGDRRDVWGTLNRSSRHKRVRWPKLNGRSKEKLPHLQSGHALPEIRDKAAGPSASPPLTKLCSALPSSYTAENSKTAHTEFLTAVKKPSEWTGITLERLLKFSI